MEFKLEHTFDCDIISFEKALDHPELNKYLEERLSDIKTREIIERRENGKSVFTSFKVVPDYVLPQSAGKYISQSMLHWMEEATRDRNAHTIIYKIIPPIFKSQFKTEFNYKFTDIGQNKTLRQVFGSIVVVFPGLGQRIEEYITPRIVKVINEEAEIISKFIEKYFPKSIEGAENEL